MRLRWLLAAAVVAGLGIADQPILARPPAPPIPTTDTARARADHLPLHGYSTASVDTFVLADYHWGTGSLDPQGWTTVDRSPRPDTIFHVEDFSGLNGGWYAPISGTRSLWCGTRTLPDFPLCDGAGCLPGYLNYWDQRFESIAFPRTGDVMVSFRARWDSEPGYDFTYVEYIDKYGYWAETFALDGRGDLPITVTIPGSDLPPTLRLRFRFFSDGLRSDEDCQYLSDGAVIIDDVVVTDDTGIIDQQDFESESVGARTTSDGHWFATYKPPYGDYAALMPGASLLQQDPCVRVVSGIWAFINGSIYNYACGGFPNYKAIPYGNGDGLYLWNELWSPMLDWDRDSGGGTIPGTASGAILSFDVYRDMPLDYLLFYQWHVRAFDASGCPTAWRDRNYVYYGGQKDWLRASYEFGDLVPPGTDKIQIALTVRDYCGYWCGVVGSGFCHGQAPMFGSVSIRRIDFTGPRWSIRDVDQFQDNFASDGTLTGSVRADMANDILPWNNLNVLPGDSSVVSVNDPGSGLADDLALGGKMVYCYVSVWPPQAAKTGANLSGGARWPLAGTETVGGAEWTRLRLDACVVAGNPVADTYCIDLNDTLFTPGDTVRFFYAAENANGDRTYAYGSSLSLQTADVVAAAADPAEFTCLPAGGWNRGGEILYVDGMDGRGAQPFWDTAFASLGLSGLVDRYDIRAPASTVDNQPTGRIQDVAAQLSACYRVILWDCGDLQSLGSGGGSPAKRDDFGLFTAFLENLTQPGGVYLCGDDVAESMQSASSFNATYIPHGAVLDNHRSSFGVSPPVFGSAGNCFDGDSFHLMGGCPLLNDFDVIEPTGTSIMEISYGPAASTNGAVISNRTSNANSVQVGVLLAGFSFVYISDDDTDGVSDRADHLADALAWLSLLPPQPTGVVERSTNLLAQNHPNPFNPMTTISFSLRASGTVSLTIYNVAGERVRMLVDEALPAGLHQRSWDGRNQAGERVGSGVYFYRLATAGFTSTRKMVLLK